MTEVMRVLKERSWTAEEWAHQVPPERMAAFLERVEARTLPGPLAKQVFAWMCDEEGDVDAILERHDVRVQSSSDELLPLVRSVLEANPGPVSQVLAGKTQTMGFLVGQVMKASGGQAVPQTVRALIEQELAGRGGGS
jgi:aspartyl-tRNA(Asn)/glutamyl-tRNA(Gln) amidotransferase subunit B